VTYSQDFEKLISTRQKTRELLLGCFFDSDNFKEWEDARAFIARTIHKDGMILDIGCANGFLLKCLPEWSGYKLDPYGIDPSKKHIKLAKELFLEIPSHFAVASIFNIPGSFINQIYWKIFVKLPEKYDFIYWNVWDNWKFDKPIQLKPIDSLSKMLNSGGRLILGFYDAKRENNTKRNDALKNFGYKLSGVLENPTGTEIIVWIDNEK